MLVVFWISVVLILFSYAIYPIILRVLAFKYKPKPDGTCEDELPFVSIIIPAFNEESVIAHKIDSVLAGDYPSNKFEILVGLDASTDRTNAIVKDYIEKYSFIHLFSFDERRGKPSVVNDLVNASHGSILILTDANVFLAKDTVSRLVQNFSDQEIGLVDTNMINIGIKKDGISSQENAYISREVQIKHLEGIIWGCMMGPFGGCYAIRREDYPHVPPHSLVDDFYINMKVLEKGKKAINDLKAWVYEDVSNSSRAEFIRKIRIATGNFQNLARLAHLLWPPYSRIAFAFFSHKVLRWFGPIFLILSLVSSAALLSQHWIYAMAFFGQLILIFGIPVLDLLLKTMHIHITPFRFIVHFYSMNLALLIGMLRFLKGVKSGVWTPTPRNQA